MWGEILADVPRDAALLILEGDTVADRLLLAGAVLLLALWAAAMAGAFGTDEDAPLEGEPDDVAESVQYGARVMSTKYKPPRG